MASSAGARRSTSSSLAKRNCSASSENPVKATTSVAAAKKRPALVNITNQRHASGSLNSSRASVPETSKTVSCSTKIVSIKKGSSTSTNGKFPGAAVLPPTSSLKQNMAANIRGTSFQRSDVVLPKTSAAPYPCRVDVSPDNSDSLSTSVDESMSTCDSLKSPDVEYMDTNELAIVDLIEQKASNLLSISENLEAQGSICKRDILASVESDDMVVDVDENLDDPQLCATIACDIYKHLRASEVKKRPATNFMERIQKDINASMRSILIDWLVEVAEEYRLVPDTLYLTINYIDRYLSGNPVDRQRLQLLGVACMMIAAKYEEICAPQVEEFCYITDNTYFKDEVLEMESSVLNYLKFEMTAPTAKCFLRRFVRAAQGVNETPLLQLECLASYIAELSLLEYSMLCFAPSMIAASSIFLAKFILLPSKRPWSSTLQHYTVYQAHDLRNCVLALHRLCCNNQNSSLPAVREKYSQHKYKFVAKKYFPPSVPQEYFHKIIS